jgi:hypothetical protein
MGDTMDAIPISQLFFGANPLGRPPRIVISGGDYGNSTLIANLVTGLRNSQATARRF